MIVGMKQVVIELEYRGIVPVADAQGTRINCLRGRLWITQHRSIDDVVLEAGESCEISRPGVTLVQALADARVALHAPAALRASAGLAPRLRQLWGRLATPATAGVSATALAGRGAI
jgi:hypothetical protein